MVDQVYYTQGFIQIPSLTGRGMVDKVYYTQGFIQIPSLTGGCVVDKYIIHKVSYRYPLSLEGVW